jgi:hypothetical protein
MLPVLIAGPLEGRFSTRGDVHTTHKSVLSVAICGGTALLLSFLLRDGGDVRYAAPALCLLVVIVVSVYFGRVAGIYGSVAANLTLAFALYLPLGGLYIQECPRSRSAIDSQRVSNCFPGRRVTRAAEHFCSVRPPIQSKIAWTIALKASGGPHTITATVASDANYMPSSGTGTLTVIKATAILVGSSASIPYGTASAILSVHLEFSPGLPNPTGAVTFQVDSGPSLTATCVGATSPLLCTVAYPSGALSIGAHTITIKFASDPGYKAASDTRTLTVTQGTPILVLSPRSILYGTASTTLAAYVEFTDVAAPTGAVTLQVDAGSSPAASCKAASSATLFCTVSYATGTLTGSSHTINASVASDTNYNATSKAGTLTVTQATPILVVSPRSIVPCSPLRARWTQSIGELSLRMD